MKKAKSIIQNNRNKLEIILKATISSKQKRYTQSLNKTSQNRQVSLTYDTMKSDIVNNDSSCKEIEPIIFPIKRPMTGKKPQQLKNCRESNNGIGVSKIQKDIEERQNYSPTRSRVTVQSVASKSKINSNRKNIRISMECSLKPYEYNSPQQVRMSGNYHDALELSASQINLESSMTSMTKDLASTAHIKGSRNDKDQLGLGLVSFIKNPRDQLRTSQVVTRRNHSKRRAPSQQLNMKGKHILLNQSLGGQTTASFNQNSNPYTSFDSNSIKNILGGSTIMSTKFNKSNKISYINHQAGPILEIQLSRKTRNSSFAGYGASTTQDIAMSTTFSAKKCAALVKIENKDLGIQFFDQNFQRFKEYCQKQCINRKIKLIDGNFQTQYPAIVEHWFKYSHRIGIDNLRDQGAKALIKAVAKSRSLVHLDLSSNQITYKGAKKVFKCLLTNSSLISLKIGSIDSTQKNKVGHKGISMLVTLLQHSQYLQFLDLRGNILTDVGIEELCKGLQHNQILIYLNISNNDITSYGLNKLKESLLSTNIKELDVSQNPIGNQGIDYLATYLQHNDCVLEKLNVSDCKIYSAGSVQLFNSIKKNAHLRSLTLDKNDIRSRNMNYLTNSIFHGLQYLSMNQCNLRDEGGVAVAEGLSRSRNLRTLLVSYNQIGDEAAKEFAEAIARSTVNIEYLDLSYNRINDAGGELIALAMKENNSLSRLNLKRNNMKDTTGKVMAESLQFNKQIQYLILEKNPIPLNFIEAIQEVLQCNMIRAAKNKVPQYKNEVTLLKVEHANHFDYTQREIRKCTDNHNRLLREIGNAELVFEETQKYEQERYLAIEKEKLKIDQRIQDQSMMHFDEEIKMKQIMQKKEKEIKEKTKWIKKLRDEQDAFDDNMLTLKTQVEKRQKEYMDQVSALEKELRDTENLMEQAKLKYQEVKNEYRKLSNQDLYSPQDALEQMTALKVDKVQQQEDTQSKQDKKKGGKKGKKSKK